MLPSCHPGGIHSSAHPFLRLLQLALPQAWAPSIPLPWTMLAMVGALVHIKTYIGEREERRSCFSTFYTLYLPSAAEALIVPRYCNHISILKERKKEREGGSGSGGSGGLMSL